MSDFNFVMEGMAKQVLNHGYVKFISSMGTDESIIEAARMSTGKGFEGWEKDAKLLEYLYKNQHMTPFEMCQIIFEVQAPIAVFREWQRHRTGGYNEFSARYAQMPNLHYLPELGRFQKQSTQNKQGSAEAFPPETARSMQASMKREQFDVYDNYEVMIEEGLAKEIARLNTPVSRFSKMRVTMNLRNWFQFLNLRMRPNAQWEIRQYADVVSHFLAQLYPRSHALFLEHDLNGARLSASDVQLMRSLIGDDPQTPEAAAFIKRFAT